MSVDLKVNGVAERIDSDNFSVEYYLMKKDIKPETVAVEINYSVIAKDKYASTIIKDNDEIEIVRFVGGGA